MLLPKQNQILWEIIIEYDYDDNYQKVVDYFQSSCKTKKAVIAQYKNLLKLPNWKKIMTIDAKQKVKRPQKPLAKTKR